MDKIEKTLLAIIFVALIGLISSLVAIRYELDSVLINTDKLEKTVDVIQQ